MRRYAVTLQQRGIILFTGVVRTHLGAFSGHDTFSTLFNIPAPYYLMATKTMTTRLAFDLETDERRCAKCLATLKEAYRSEDQALEA